MGDDLENYYVTGRSALVTKRAGESARQKSKELRQDRPIWTALLRVAGVRSEDQDWDRGGAGEERVGRQLKSLPTDRWHVFNDVAVGDRGTNIDHIVIGPAGVFTINTKNLSGNVWVAERAFLCNGKKTAYLPKAVSEAKRASRSLSKAAGLRVQAQPLLAVFAARMTIKAPPADVVVVQGNGLVKWLLEQSAVMSAAQAMTVARAADNPATWT